MRSKNGCHSCRGEAFAPRYGAQTGLSGQPHSESTPQIRRALHSSHQSLLKGSVVNRIEPPHSRFVQLVSESNPFRQGMRSQEVRRRSHALVVREPGRLLLPSPLLALEQRRLVEDKRKAHHR